MFLSLTDNLNLGLVLIFAVTTATYLCLSQRQLKLVLSKIAHPLRRRRVSGASTPPRSFSPEKKSEDPDSATAPDHSDVIPPSRHDALASIAAKLRRDSVQRAALSGPAGPSAPSQDDFMPTTRTYHATKEPPKYTITGFSTDEITALGDFPD